MAISMNSLNPQRNQLFGVFKACSRDETLAVTVDRHGASLAVQIAPEAMEVGGQVIAARIIQLTALAALRARLRLRRDSAGGTSQLVPSKADIAALARLLDAI